MATVPTLAGCQQLCTAYGDACEHRAMPPILSHIGREVPELLSGGLKTLPPHKKKTHTRMLLGRSLDYSEGLARCFLGDASEHRCCRQIACCFSLPAANNCFCAVLQLTERMRRRMSTRLHACTATMSATSPAARRQHWQRSRTRLPGFFPATTCHRTQTTQTAWCDTPHSPAFCCQTCDKLAHSRAIVPPKTREECAQACLDYVADGCVSFEYGLQVAIASSSSSESRI